MAKSSYSYQAKAIETDKYATVRLKIEEIYIESSMTYEYRRIHSDLKLEKYSSFRKSCSKNNEGSKFSS